MDERDFEKFKQKVRGDTGFDLNQYSQEYVKRRIGSRMAMIGLKPDEWGGYIKAIDKNPEEYPKLFDFFSVNVTEFFRDPSLWRKLRKDTLPNILKDKAALKSTCFRVWSAGCSTGEEPYSLAMTLKDMIPSNMILSITATDIDADALTKAQAGLYSKESLKNIGLIDQTWLSKYFTKEVDEKKKIERFRISNDVKRMVLFKKHSFLADQPLTQMDMIICRNAMIYISHDVKDKLLEIFHRSLCHGGYLIVGKSEIIFMGKSKNLYYPVDAVEHIYRKERRKIGSDSYVPSDSDRRKNWWPGKKY